MPPWLTEEEQRAWRGLLAMNTQLLARLNRDLQESSGLSLADYDVLVALTDVPDGTRRFGELGEALQWEKSRLSKHLSRMAARGLVERTGSTEDRRGAWITITAEGRNAIEEAAPDHVDLVRDLVFGQLSATQVRTLSRISSAVLERIGADEATA